MKGKIICPKCKNEFILELTEDKKIHSVICPKCKNKFSVKAKSDSKEVCWEEYGEPRKTVLSCIKPRSNRPLIAILLLVCIFLIGILTAVSSDIFINSISYVTSFLNLNDTINMNIAVCSIIIVIFSIFALFAIFACIKRKYYILAIVGSFLSIFSFGFFFIGSILGIIALALIFTSRDEFENGKKAKIF